MGIVVEIAEIFFCSRTFNVAREKSEQDKTA
jgi:hypothetical protein